MADKKINPDELSPFCKRAWQPLAFVMGVICLATFGWGFHVLKDSSFWQSEFDYFSGDGPASGLSVGGKVIEQLNSVIRQTVVNVGGVDANGQARVSGAGSGVLINPDGYVIAALHSVSNIHDVAVTVRTLGGPKQYRAEIVKVVPSHNIVLLKLISNDIFPFMSVGDSLALQPGETVYAFGNSPGSNLVAKKGMIGKTGIDVNLGGTLFTNMIQTDAVYIWSQSGGPLLNDKGVMIGLNIAADTPGRGVTGYAIPSHVVVAHFQDVVQFMTSTGAVGQSFAQSPANAPGGMMQNPNWEPLETEGINAAATRPLPQFRQYKSVKPPAKRTKADDWWKMARATIERQNTMITQGFGRNDGGADTGPWPLGLNAALKNGQTGNIDTSHSGWTLWGYSIKSIIGLLALGLVAGISGGMMTMGGGIIKVTGLMLFFGYGAILIRPVAYITNIFLYGSAALRYSRDNLIIIDKVRRLIPWAMGGVVLGYFMGNYLGHVMIQYLLGVFAFSLSVKILIEIFQPSDDEDEPKREIKKDERKSKSGSALDRLVEQDGYLDKEMVKEGMLGVPMGVVSGILGISGGVIEVPLQRYVAKIPLKNAIANSAVMIFFASLVGSVVAMVHGTSIGAFEWKTPFLLAFFLTPGAYAGGVIGAWLTKTAPVNVLKWVYVILMFVISIKMFLLP